MRERRIPLLELGADDGAAEEVEDEEVVQRGGTELDGRGGLHGGLQGEHIWEMAGRKDMRGCLSLEGDGDVEEWWSWRRWEGE